MLENRRQHKETLQLYHEPSEQFAAQPQRSFGYGPNPNVPTGPRFTPVAEPGMQVFPPWVSLPFVAFLLEDCYYAASPRGCLIRE